MEVPKNEQDPNEPLQARIRRLAGLQPGPHPITVTSFEDWDVGEFPIPGGDDGVYLLAVGIGEPRLVEFNEPMLEHALTWLADERQGWLSGVRQAMGGPDRTLDISLLPPEEDFYDAFYELFTVAGDLGLGHHGLGLEGDPLSVDLFGAAYQLAPLRSAVGLSLALQTVDTPASFWESIERGIESSEPGIVDQIYRRLGGRASGRLPLARLVMLADMNTFQLGHVLEVREPGKPALVAPPQTPLQLIWYTAALAAGAITTPRPVPGVFRCSYHLCQRLFVSRKLGVGGSRRFCCIEHGKRFYAARRMKEKGARARLETTTDAGLEG